MRLPADSILLLGADADPELARIWREEQLATRPLPCHEAELEALPTATLVVCGEGAIEAATLAARLGFRTFLVGDGAAPEGVRVVTPEDARAAALQARARERWKAARAASG